MNRVTTSHGFERDKGYYAQVYVDSKLVETRYCVSLNEAKALTKSMAKEQVDKLPKPAPKKKAVDKEEVVE